MIHSSNPFSRNIEILKASKQTMSFRPNEDYELQRLAISAKFRELIKIPEAVTTPLPIAEAPDTDDPRFDEIRFLFESEPGFYVPAHLVYPKQITEKNTPGNLPAGTFSRNARIPGTGEIPR